MIIHISEPTRIVIRRMESGRIRMSFQNGFPDEFFSDHEEVAERIDLLHNCGLELFVTDEVYQPADTGINVVRCGRAAGPFTMRD